MSVRPLGTRACGRRRSCGAWRARRGAAAPPRAPPSPAAAPPSACGARQRRFVRRERRAAEKIPGAPRVAGRVQGAPGVDLPEENGLEVVREVPGDLARDEVVCRSRKRTADVRSFDIRRKWREPTRHPTQQPQISAAVPAETALRAGRRGRRGGEEKQGERDEEEKSAPRVASLSKLHTRNWSPPWKSARLNSDDCDGGACGAAERRGGDGRRGVLRCRRGRRGVRR